MSTDPTAQAAPPSADPALVRYATSASYALMAIFLLLTLRVRLLPGLLAVCVGFLLARWAERWIARGLGRLSRRDPQAQWPQRVASWLAVAVLVIAPIGILTGTVSQSRAALLDAPAQYLELLDYTARTVLELRQKLSPEIAVYLPEGADDLQRIVAKSLDAQAGTLAKAGRAWLNALLFCYVGLIVGALAAVYRSPPAQHPLTCALRQRITMCGEAFAQIIAAQFRIAALNTVLTGIFLLFVLPLWTRPLPHTPALITLTFFAGLVPIVGNLVCNSVITVVGLTVSPLVGLACLIFLIVIHKAEYIINAQVIGHRTQMTVWELLAVMFVAEAIFGPAGLVAAPLYYAYTKKELRAVGLI
jgi:predicted PurR-regulated permease PerM